MRHLCYSPRIHVVSAPILNHLFSQVHIDALLDKKRGQSITADRSSNYLYSSQAKRSDAWVSHLFIFAIISPELFNVDHGIHTAPLVHPAYCSDSLVLSV